jgi:NAD(P)-dependent dehydrogenase (short-subunit alcohol dehydrogenase family)
VGQLDGKVAVVTGGGRGIGRANALALARDGAAVVVNDLGGGFGGDGSASTEPAEEVVESITRAGGRAVADTSDIADWDQAAGVVDAAIAAFGRLDIVVNNAGITRFGSIDEVTRFDWERTLAVNLTGTGAVCHWAAVHWRKQGAEAGRRLINTTSSVALTPQPGNPMYVAAKAGVAALTVACAIELAELGVRANGLAPVARTRVSQNVAAELMNEVSDGFDRMSPDHVATVVAFLGSPRCRFTGRIFGVVGDDVTVFDGWTAAHHIVNGEQPWTVGTLAAALDETPAQHSGWAQAVKGIDPVLTPSDELLKRLAEIEKD